MNSIPLTTLITIVAGVAVFAASQYVLKLILEPLVELRKTIVGVSNALLYHQAAITNAHPKEEIATSIRKLSADLRSNASLIPCYRFLHLLGIFKLPKKDNLLKACHELNLLSYRMDPAIENDEETGRAIKNKRSIDEIGEMLNIETTYLESSSNARP